MSARHQYQAMLKTAESILALCAPTSPPCKISLAAAPLLLSLPADHEILPATPFLISNPDVRKRLLRLARDLIEISQCRARSTYEEMCAGMISLRHYGLNDAELTRHCAQAVEEWFRRHIKAVHRTLIVACDRFMAAQDEGGHRKTSGFNATSTRILEAAFLRSQSLTARECTLVAEAAGISHQQVRTWNKRNRGNKSRRNGSTSDIPAYKCAVEPTVPEQRVISALPRRSQQKILADTDAGQDKPAARAVRGLPKRKPAPTVESPAKSETSSLDSIPSSGGFLSPLNATTSNPPIITFPDDHNARPQAAHPWMLGDGIFESPMDMGCIMPWDAAFNFDLGNFEQSIQAVLDDPTLSGSPALSYGASTDTDGNPIGTPEDEYLKLGLSELDGDELLQMLNNAEYIPSMEEMLVDCATAEADLGASANWDRMGGSSAEMQMEETVVTVEEVGSSWSGSSGWNTPSSVESLPAGQATPDNRAPAIDNAPSATSTAPHVIETSSGSQKQQHAMLAPSVIVTGPTSSPVAYPVESACPLQSQEHHLQYAHQLTIGSHSVSMEHEHPSYPCSIPAQPGQVQHIYYAAPPPHVYYAVPYPPQPYPPTQQESTWIAGALPFDNVYAQQPVHVVYGAPPHGVDFPMDTYEQHSAQGQAMADGGVWT